MAALFEGNLNGKAINPEVGGDKQGRPRVRWEMEVTEGPHTGKRASYSGKLDPENIKYTKRDMMAIGWQGKDVRTFVDDVKAFGKPVAFVAEIAEYEGRQWTSAKMSSGGAPLAKLEADKIKDVNSWFAEAGGDEKRDDIPF